MRPNIRFLLGAAIAAGISALPFTGLCQEEGPRAQYAAEGMRDPFQTYIVKEKVENTASAPVQTEVLRPFPKFVVQGVFWGANYPQAIVNDKIVKEGDIIEEAKVLSISREKIRFLFTNREFSVMPSAIDSTNSTESRKEAP